MKTATRGRRRAYGQHFLKDRSIAARIADAAIELARKRGSAAILEIGPGRGAITEPLLDGIRSVQTVQKFYLCEKDRSLAAHWSERAHQVELDHLLVLDSDFLELKPPDWLSLTPLTVASNLPYSSGTAIFVELAKHPTEINGMVLMFQSEVAQRLRATQGTKDWGSLSIWTQNRWSVKKLLTVAPGSFSPPPQVTSEVVVIEPLSEPIVPIPDEATWNSLLKACFQHRRKMLRAGLPKSGPLRNALELSGVDDTKRAEALDWTEWGRLYGALLKTGGSHEPRF